MSESESLRVGRGWGGGRVVWLSAMECDKWFVYGRITRDSAIKKMH